MSNQEHWDIEQYKEYEKNKGGIGMNDFSKLNLIISIEVAILTIAYIIIKTFIYQKLNVWYIIIAQYSLIQVQVIVLTIQEIKERQKKKEFQEMLKKLREEGVYTNEIL